MTYIQQTALQGTTIAKQLVQKIETEMQSIGLFYRIFYRIKTDDSVKKKLLFKKETYSSSGRKLQDIIGIRITLYFSDDVSILDDLIKKNYNIIDTSIDGSVHNVFGPARYNIVCKIPNELTTDIDFSNIYDGLVDNSFEIQIRTIFSEGWHEIEHDMRYKRKEEWAIFDSLSRSMNGIIATLENCDFLILKILDEISYQSYKQNNWNSMMFFKLRIRMNNEFMKQEYVECFNSSTELAKSFLRVDRKTCLSYMNQYRLNVPLTMDNIITIINYFFIKSEIIESHAESFILEKIKNAVTQNLSLI